MFDFAWTEIALIGAVALVLIGPKDMPVAIKAISQVVKKARKMAAEFQTHVDDMVKDTDLHEVRDHIRDIRSLDIRGAITRAVDGDGTIRSAFQDTPFKDAPKPPPPVVTTPVAALPEHSIASPGVQPALPAPVAGGPAGGAPAFIPPAAVARAAPAPAFIPPQAALASATHVAPHPPGAAGA